MKRNLLTLLIIFLSVLCGSSKLSAQSSGGTWGGIDWTLTDDGTLTIKPTAGAPAPDPNTTKWTWEVGQWREAVIYKSNGGASAVGGYPYDVKNVKKLIIEEGVTSIGSFTAKFPNLTGEVVIPSTVTYIGQEAFQNVPITKLTFAPGGTENNLFIAHGAFKAMINIEEIIFPADRPEIDLNAWLFIGCTNLKHVTFPANIIDFRGTNNVDYNHNPNTQTGGNASSFAYWMSNGGGNPCSSLETITFGSEEVKNLYMNSGGNSGGNLPPAGTNVEFNVQGPALKASEIGLHHITLSWDAIENATGYKVYNGEELIAELLTETTFTAYDLDPNTQYCFSVSTVYETEESAKSEICVTTLQPVAKVGNTEYGSISAAYNIAQEGETITIINTPTAGKDLFYEVNEINKEVTIDFDAYTYAITVAEGRSLSLSNCTLKLNDNVITNNGTLNLNSVTLIGSGSNIVLKGNGTTTISSTCKVTNGYLEYYGGELFNQSTNIPAIAKKDFDGVTGHTQNWSTISTPIANAAIPEATVGTHDLYRYNEEQELWEYFNDDEDQSQGEVSNPFDKLELGRGYLYANAEDITLELEGNLNVASIGPISLNYTEGNSLAGFNFIGNPFTHTITRSNIKTSPSMALSTGFYVVGANGTWIAKTDSNDKIAPMESVLIKANGPGDLIIHSNNGSKRAARNENSYLTINVASKTHSDVTHISFNEGMGLDKINHRNPDNPMIYIPVDGKNYAIAMMDKDVKEVPVYFNANRMAEYTISIEQKNCEFSSVVLVDKLTGVETNLLIEDYSFMARSFDNADRFIIRLSIEDNDDSETENFAYVSNGSIVIEKIEGNANIRIFDIMGRHIMGTNATGNANIPVETMSTGMYIIQMSDDNGVKVQKIIIE